MKSLPVSIVAATLLVGRISGSAVARPSGQSQHAHRAHASEDSKNSMREIYGKIVSVDGSRITIETRTGHAVKVDAGEALRAYMSVPLVVGRFVGAKGISDAKGVLHARLILRAKDSSKLWPADR